MEIKIILNEFIIQYFNLEIITDISCCQNFVRTFKLLVVNVRSSSTEVTYKYWNISNPMIRGFSVLGRVFPSMFSEFR